MSHQQGTSAPLKIVAPAEGKNKVAIQDDPGPFELAASGKVEEYGPVLVIVPLEESVDFVIVELSPIDVHHREKLRVDKHSMTYLSLLPTFDQMKAQGLTFQFYSAKKDYVSDTFAILCGLSNTTVASVMDSAMPESHNFQAHFVFLGRHGEHSPSRDAGNKTGGEGQGCQIDLGACDHNFTGDNPNGLGPAPKTNGGFKCFKVIGDAENDDHIKELRACFGSMMDAVQRTVDEVRDQFGFRRIFDDIMREESFAAPLRKQLGATASRAEVSSNFVTAMDGNDGCSFHVDNLNCKLDTYDFTCCSAVTVESKGTGCLYRVVTNLNSRSACGVAMAGETKHAPFFAGLKTEMERINSSYKEVYGEGINEPTAATFTSLCLTDDLPWGEEKQITLASAPSRDFFLSAAASAVYSLQEKEEFCLDCGTIVGLLLISIYMSSCRQLHIILLTIRDDAKLLERIKTDLPGVYCDASKRLFPKFWGGGDQRFCTSAFEFHDIFVEDYPRFERAVAELKELLKLVNSSLDSSVVAAKIKVMARSASLPCLHVFRLQLFIPLAALCGLILPDHLFHADHIEPSEGVTNGSFSALTEAGIPRHRHSDALMNICGQVGLQRRLSFGECLACESHRSRKRCDLFMYGQNLFHLFHHASGHCVQLKRFNSKTWEPITCVTKQVLQSGDCA